MSEKTEATTFAELLERGILEIGDGYRAKLDELGGDGPIFLRAGLLNDQGFNWAAAERFNSDRAAKVVSKLGYPGDTMVTTKGNSVGRTGYVPQGAPEFVYSPHLSYWRSLDHTRLAPGFLRYWSRSPEFVMQLGSMANSTDMAPYLSLADQRRLRISLPGIRSQEETGRLLGALDDKIDANGRILTAADCLLEAHFSAISRNAEREVTLGKVAELKYGKALKEEDRTHGTIPVYGGNGISGWHNASLANGPGIIVGRKGANAGSVSWSQGPFWAIDTSFYVEAIEQDVPLEFLFFLLGEAGLRNLVGDSAIPGLNREIALKCSISIPKNDVIRRFVETAVPMFVLSAQIIEESRNLVELRDALLPGLIEGGIRVRDAEKVVEDVT